MSVVAARGFKAAATHAGVKPDGELDLALVAADRAVPAAAVFTRSSAPAAPVVLSQASLAASVGMARAVVLNSGCANAGTGPAGMSHARAMGDAAAASLGCPPEHVLVCSTGPIGTTLPTDIAHHVGRLEASLGAHGDAAARAILTTDTRPKQASATVDGGWTIGGMAKGAGMLRPDMATMLAVVTSDAVAEPQSLSEALAEAVDVTFNSLNVDGCMSTNDTVVLLSSGGSGIAPPPFEFAEALTAVCRQLAWQMAEDAEGSSRVVTIEIVGADTDRAARALGKAMADSTLVRSAFYGGDPNWGRLLAAAGASGLPFDVDSFGVSYQNVPVAEGGMMVAHDESGLLELMEGDLEVQVRVGTGRGEALVVTTDLTPEYVRFNGARS